MSLYTELQVLKAEEMVLVKLTSKFNDQLNRLKVEELALLSELREENKPSDTEDKQLKQESMHEDVIDESAELNLEVKKIHHDGEVEEEEEEEDLSHDPLTAFMTDQQKMQHHRT